MGQDTQPRFDMQRQLLHCSAVFAILVTAPRANAAETDRAAATPRPRVVVTPQALQIHREGLLIDGHNDLLYRLRQLGQSSFDTFDIAQRQQQTHTDIPRLREGGVGAQFWSVYVSNDTAYDGTALTSTLDQIELVKNMIEHYPNVFELALTADDIERIHQAGKIASMIGVEGGYSIENSLENLRRLYGLGARYMTLTHVDNLDWADSATDSPQHGGLTEFGEEVVREMNRLGMLVDLSHVSSDTMKDALRVATAPVIFSHSSARAMADHPRNVPNDVLKLLARNGGVAMVNFYSGFVVPAAAELRAERDAERRRLQSQFGEDPSAKQKIAQELKRWGMQHPTPPGTIHDVVDHIDHMVEVAGIDHVGLGSDFDGVEKLPDQLPDVSAYPLITQALLNRGYSQEQIHKIMGQNLLRAMREAERAATKANGRCARLP
ncbi:MAG: dipeptidase [Pirellulales bacterium]|nr:dipeptidase [Pirellulales bacterium]